jgi:hypothetical protein
MIELELRGTRGSPDRDAKAWLRRMAEADRMRGGVPGAGGQGA